MFAGRVELLTRERLGRSEVMNPLREEVPVSIPVGCGVPSGSLGKRIMLEE